MQKKASRYLFYLIHCITAYIIGTITMYMYFKKFVLTTNSYIDFALDYTLLLFCIVNFIIMFFSYRLLKIEKGKKFYLTLFINYVIVNICSYLTFYLAIYVLIIIRLMLYGLY